MLARRRFLAPLHAGAALSELPAALKAKAKFRFDSPNLNMYVVMARVARVWI
jgi:hypothetical protein